MRVTASAIPRYGAAVLAAVEAVPAHTATASRQAAGVWHMMREAPLAGSRDRGPEQCVQEVGCCEASMKPAAGAGLLDQVETGRRSSHMTLVSWAPAFRAPARVGVDQFVPAPLAAELAAAAAAAAVEATAREATRAPRCSSSRVFTTQMGFVTQHTCRTRASKQLTLGPAMLSAI